MKKFSMIFLVFLSGCAGFFTVPSKEALKHPMPPLDQKTETTLFRPGFNRESLDAGGVAILPIKKRGGPEGFRRNTTFELFQALRAYFPASRVVPRSDLVRRAREKEHFSGLKAFQSDYEESGRMDLARLRLWGKREGVRYFFIGQIVANDKHTATRTMKLSEDGVAGKVIVFSSGPVHIPYDVHKNVSLAGELWDAKCGKVVWIGTSGAEVTELGERERVRVEDIFISVTRNLIGEMNKAMKEGSHAPAAPC